MGTIPCEEREVICPPEIPIHADSILQFAINSASFMAHLIDATVRLISTTTPF
jgi:hypothetical protein